MLVTIFLGANDAAFVMGEEAEEERGGEISHGLTKNPDPLGENAPLSTEDSTKRGQSSSQHVPLQEYKTNIVTIITHVKKVEIVANTLT